MRNSAWMEHEGLLRAMQVISDAGLSIDQLITDRHKQNTAWIRRNLPDTAHYFDIWHVSKGKEAYLKSCLHVLCLDITS